MKRSIILPVTLLGMFTAVAQVDSTMTTQLNRQIQNKSSMNKSSGNVQAPSTENIQDTRKARKMVLNNDRGTIRTNDDKGLERTAPIISTPATAPNNENTNTVTPSVINGNKDSMDAGTKVPTP